MAESISLQATVPFELSGSRLDQIAAELFPDYSRSRLQSWIKSGELTVNGMQRKPKEKLNGGEELKIEATEENNDEWVAQDIALTCRPGRSSGSGSSERHLAERSVASRSGYGAPAPCWHCASTGQRHHRSDGCCKKPDGTERVGRTATGSLHGA